MSTYFRSAFDYLKSHIFPSNCDSNSNSGPSCASNNSNGQGGPNSISTLGSSIHVIEGINSNNKCYKSHTTNSIGVGFGSNFSSNSNGQIGIPIHILGPQGSSKRNQTPQPPHKVKNSFNWFGVRQRQVSGSGTQGHGPSVTGSGTSSETSKYYTNHINNNSNTTSFFGLKTRKRKWEEEPSKMDKSATDNMKMMESYRKMVNAISSSDEAIISNSFRGNRASISSLISRFSVGDNLKSEIKRPRINARPHGYVHSHLSQVREAHREVISMFDNWNSPEQGTKISRPIQKGAKGADQVVAIDNRDPGTTGSKTREVAIYSAGLNLGTHSSKSKRIITPEIITLDDNVQDEVEVVEPKSPTENEVVEVPGPTWSPVKYVPKVPHTPAPTTDADIQILKEIKSPPRSTNLYTGNTLELEQRSSKYHKKSWLVESTTSYRDSQRCKKNEIELEQKKLALLQSEKNVTTTKDLEERMRRNLKITGVIVLEEDEKPRVPPMPPLTEEMLEFVSKKMRGPSNEVLRTPTVTLTKNDLKTLAPCQWLNDMVINTYMDLIVSRAKTDTDKYPIVHAFTTFFYPKYLNEGHSNILKRWTRKVDLFSVDIILFPIHLGVHWALAVADVKGKSIKYYDSLLGRQQRCLDALLNYLSSEHKEKKGSQLDRAQWTLELVRDIPTQENGSDCGVFTCQFAEYLSRRAPITFGQTHMPYFRDRMKWELLNQQILS